MRAAAVGAFLRMVVSATGEGVSGTVIWLSRITALALHAHSSVQSLQVRTSTLQLLAMAQATVFISGSARNMYVDIRTGWNSAISLPAQDHCDFSPALKAMQAAASQTIDACFAKLHCHMHQFIQRSWSRQETDKHRG